ncbi:MAG: DNA-processing protein DprA [Rectinemataceae bacterium]|nr:DNA-processing protein DprA [Rectinemataceae bacterium]
MHNTHDVIAARPSRQGQDGTSDSFHHPLRDPDLSTAIPSAGRMDRTGASISAGQRMKAVLVAIHRLGRLRLDEKILLSDLCRDPRDLENLSAADLVACTGRERSAEEWHPSRAIALAVADLELFDRMGIAYIHYDDLRYPPLLRETAVPPFGLFVRGRLPDPDKPHAALVGTRSPTGSGLSAASSLASDLARAGIPVVSGLALGIDSAAHRGALSVNGYTLAVLPCGIDRIYPPSNRGLAARILDSGGGLASEYPPGAGIHKYRFPERNRIIAGISRACVVVEAPAISGALITAEHALSEGRDVWVHSACAGGPRNAGADNLAGEGACVLSGAGELLRDWGMPLPSRTGGRTGRNAPGNSDGQIEGEALGQALRLELGLESGLGAARGSDTFAMKPRSCGEAAGLRRRTPALPELSKDQETYR